MFTNLTKFRFPSKIGTINIEYVRNCKMEVSQIGRLIDLLDSNSLEEISPENANEIRAALEEVLWSLLLKVSPKDKKLFNNRRIMYLGKMLILGGKNCALAILYSFEITKCNFAEAYIVEFLKDRNLLLQDNITQEATRILDTLRSTGNKRSLLRPYIRED